MGAIVKIPGGYRPSWRPDALKSDQLAVYGQLFRLFRLYPVSRVQQPCLDRDDKRNDNFPVRFKIHKMYFLN